MTTDLQRAIELTRKAASAYGRPDLVERVDLVRARTETVPLILVVGEYKSGKSSLVNAVTVEPVCPATPEAATTVPTVVYLGGPRGAIAVSTDSESATPIDIEALPEIVTDDSDAWEHTERVEIRLGMLDEPDEFALVDTPGAGGWTGRLGARAVGWLPLAMATLVLHDGASPLTASEMELIELAHRLCPNVSVAVTRTDLHPAWRQIVRDTQTRLSARGLDDIVVFPVSARLAAVPEAHAIARSGIDDVLAWMVSVGAGGSSNERLRACCLSVVHELTSDLAAERAHHLQPTEDVAVEEPTRASPVLPWQTILGDGISDLGSDIDAHWKAAGRELLRRSEEHLEGSDPTRDWATFETWLRQESTAAAAEVFAQLQGGLRDLTDRLAEALHAEAREVTSDPSSIDVDMLGDLELDLRLQAAAGLGSRSFTALRASYSGMALAGMMAGVAGLSLAGPALIVFGVAMGGKSVRDERKKQRDQGEQQARAAARRYLDDVGAFVQQSLRDGLRTGQRSLRDRCLLLADGIEERRKRRDPGDLSAAERDRRVADLDAELERLAKLHARIDRLPTTQAVST